MENKHSLCPLCGGEPKRFESPFQSELYAYGCPECEFITFWGVRLHWLAWEALVSKFPPIMRIEIGDILELCNGDLVTVSDINEERDHFKTKGGNVWLNSSVVRTWPWELEVKGGDQ
jgi:hypothetical protein|nr:MAG TPA: zinc-ribbon domain protein [Caudoviricetes sp.]